MVMNIFPMKLTVLKIGTNMTILVDRSKKKNHDYAGKISKKKKFRHFNQFVIIIIDKKNDNDNNLLFWILLLLLLLQFQIAHTQTIVKCLDHLFISNGLSGLNVLFFLFIFCIIIVMAWHIIQKKYVSSTSSIISVENFNDEWMNEFEKKWIWMFNSVDWEGEGERGEKSWGKKNQMMYKCHVQFIKRRP